MLRKTHLDWQISAASVFPVVAPEIQKFAPRDTRQCNTKVATEGGGLGSWVLTVKCYRLPMKYITYSYSLLARAKFVSPRNY